MSGGVRPRRRRPPWLPALLRTVVVSLVAAAYLASPVTAGVAHVDVGDGERAENATGEVLLAGVLANPAADGDAGEYLVLSFPEPTDVSGWSVADGETVARFPNRTLAGRVVATTDPGATHAPSDATVVRLRGRLALANAGETIRVRDGAEVVASVAYEDAPEGKVFARESAGWSWRTPGRTDLPVVTDRDVPARLFVLPDEPSVPVAAIEAADDRVLVGAYSFASMRVSRALCAARSRGVRVEVLVEGEPVGGVTRWQARALDRLAGCEIPVSVLGGPGDRYGVHHAKYAVVDDRALVVSENWKPAGVGGRSSRGWGVLLDSPRIADGLARTFRADAGYRDARPWADVRPRTDLVAAPRANGSYPRRFAATDVVVDHVALHLAPDNAESGVLGLLESAETRVTVQQVSVGGEEGPFTNATVGAPRRGVATRVLLSGAWYVEADNRRLAERLNRLGRREGVPIRARLASPRSRFEKTHVKGLLVDEEVAVVGSLNWNAYAARENREVLVVLTDPAAAAYYGRVFRADWRGGSWRLPVGFGLATLAAAMVSGLVLGRAVRFEGQSGKPPPEIIEGPLG